MGVKGLWKLLEPAGRPVNLDSLQDVILAVDVSIWLNQAVKGMRDSRGDPLPHAHLVVLFNRVCKLLHYKIKPVFVFDGATPSLKRQTLAERSKRRVKAGQHSLKTRDKQVTKFLQSKILEQVYGERSAPSPPAPVTADPPDMYQLPPLPENILACSPEPSLPPPSHSADHTHQIKGLDIHSDDFNSLPPEVQHELLLERQQLNTHTHHHPDTLPQVASDFSSYQLSKLMKQSHTTRKLEEVRKVLKSNETAVMGLNDAAHITEVETSRILSSEDAHYILVKSTAIDGQSMDIGGGSKEEEEDHNSVANKANEVESIKVKESINVVAVDRNPLTEYYTTIKDELVYFIDSDSDSSLDQPPLKRIKPMSPDTKIPEDVPLPLSSNGPDGLMTPDFVSNPHETVKSPPQPVVSAQSHTTPQQSAPPSFDVKTQADALTPSLDVRTQADALPPSLDVRTQADALTPSLDVRTQADTLTPSLDVRTEADALPPSLDVRTQADALTPSLDVRTQAVKTQADALTPSLDVRTQADALPPSLDVRTQADALTPSLDVRTQADALTPSLDVRTQADALIPSLDTNISPQQSYSEWDDGLLSLAPQEAQDQLREEVTELERERGRQSRAAASVSNTMYKEAQELFTLFGLPYLVAPGEAEAQCAYLETSGQVEGVLTDDNDALLFGAQAVYRGFFSQDRDPELYNYTDIQETLGICREQLVLLGYLLGCDYTPGLEGVGIVSAMELLRDFPGDRLEPLEKIRDWLNEATLKPALLKQASGVLKKISQSELPVNFAEPAVYQAYFTPDVDCSAEEFEWGKPDLDLLRKFAFERINWDQTKVDSLLLPLLRRLNSEQRLITRYLPSVPQEAAPSRKSIKSKRIRNVIARFKHKEQDPPSTKRRRQGPNKKKPPTETPSALSPTISASSSDSD